MYKRQLEGQRLVRLEEYDALELAMKVLSDANDELRQRFSPLSTRRQPVSCPPSPEGGTSTSP